MSRILYIVQLFLLALTTAEAQSNGAIVDTAANLPSSLEALFAGSAQIEIPRQLAPVAFANVGFDITLEVTGEGCPCFRSVDFLALPPSGSSANDNSTCMIMWTALGAVTGAALGSKEGGTHWIGLGVLGGVAGYVIAQFACK